VTLAILPDEFNRSKSKIAKSDLRAERSSGWGATTGGLALVNRYHERLTEGFRVAASIRSRAWWSPFGVSPRSF
jgi:hypothetical protein